MEELETRRLMAGDAPEVLLASVYFEEASQNDSAPDVIEVTFVGGAAGTTLDRLVIDGDKEGNGLSAADVIFDTVSGGLGVFGSSPYQEISSDGFTVTSVSVQDGGTQIVFTFSGFDAGEKFRFAVDVDEIQFVGPGAVVDGVVDPTKVDVNSVVEGAEFQRSIMTGEFSAPHYVDLTLQGLYWDFYDPIFAAAHSATGLNSGLPTDVYSTTANLSVWTAGAIDHDPQIPLASLSGWVYHDRSDDGVFNTATEEGIGGVTLELLNAAGTPTGRTTVTSSNPATLGYYEFLDLEPGTYGVREVQPAGWLDGKDTPGDHGGTADASPPGDRIRGAVLTYGDEAVNYNFGELLPGSISGNVHASPGPDCIFRGELPPCIGFDSGGSVIYNSLTNLFSLNALPTSLETGEVFTTGSLDIRIIVDESGTLVSGVAGNDLTLVGGLDLDGDFIADITGTLLTANIVAFASTESGLTDTYELRFVVAGGLLAAQYAGADLVVKTTSENSNFTGSFATNFAGNAKGEMCTAKLDEMIPLQGVQIDLLDSNGNFIRSTFTDVNGDYEFTGLTPGNYQVREHQPTDYYDGGEYVGTLGGASHDVPEVFSFFTDIEVGSDEHGILYDFCEKIPVTLSGNVYHDRSNDGIFDRPTEEGIGAVQLMLLDAGGNDTGLRALTNSAGHYEFTDLRAGTYTVVEIHPAGWIDGKDTPGNLGGVADLAPLGDKLSQITINWGEAGVEYNFGELLPGSIRGRVHADDGPDCNFDDPHHMLEGVQIDLLDANGNVLAVTFTNADGEYAFTGLMPGIYSVREHDPEEYFDGGERVGTLGGASHDVAEVFSFFTAINVGSDQHGIQYDFCEKPPASIRGRVHADHHEECDFDHPEILLEGVVIELRDAAGNLVATTTTDVNGEYKFEGLRAGEYQVHEIQPVDYYDGGERVGSAGGARDGIDTIHSIVLEPGMNAIQYDFCEKVGVTLSGNVYHDRSDDGIFNRPTEEGIGEVELRLLDASGVDTGLRAFTNSAGYYEFTNLRAGTYTVVEIHPVAWLDGKDTPGNLGGVADASPPGDRLSQISINWGETGIEYNFGELLPGSIRGRVHADEHEDCNFDEPEILLEGVRIDLLDSAGNVIAVTFTDENGEYEFTGLKPGTYSVREHQPTEYFDGGERIGTLGGTKQDIGQQFSIFNGINVGSDQHGIQYDFCEKVGVMLSGNVYHDRSNDGIFDRLTEEGIGNVELRLLDANGNDTGLRATTNASGAYKFNNLVAGTYRVLEIHPVAWLDGKDTPGNLGGVADASPPGDLIRAIVINWGEAGVEYNFGERERPGSIRGRVHADDEPDCNFDDPHVFLEGVRIDLLDGDGNLLATTFTNAAGEYEFTDLRPGTYSVREHQPTDYFDGGERIGTAGGDKHDVEGVYSIFTDIEIGANEHAVQYDFCEKPPGELSGYVYIDGAPILIEEDQVLTPQQIAAVRDGVRTPDDTPLRNVVLELRQGVSGDPIFVGQALPGFYTGGPDDAIRVVTDANGFYSFKGLPAGTYAVVEIQPAGVLDNLDTPGTLGGFAVNALGLNSGPDGPPPLGVQANIEQFREQFGDNAIIRIPLLVGQHSEFNNFSEVVTRLEIPPPETPDPPPAPPVFGPPGSRYIAPLRLPLIPPIDPPPDIFGGSSQALGFTWHLSVVNAGWPRSMTPGAARFQLTSAHIDVAGWMNAQLNQSRWTLATVYSNDVIVLREEMFGRADGVPVTGDFNGDGVTDLGVFIDGQWFLDLNGNGIWDEGDMWAQLGSQDDVPVTGDWDADGKTDIGIYGPAWPRDPWAIEREPGLPDADNFPTRPEGKMKNMPPTAEEATDGTRLLKRTAAGKSRADLIDHVFHYGTPNDVPITGDWNGDSIRQIGVFREGEWNLDTDGDGRFTEVDEIATFGQSGDRPVIGDFNGDGIDELGVFRAGQWILDTNHNREIDAQDKVFELGGAGDIPVVGDWDDDGIDDPGVYQPGQATDRLTRRAG